MTTGPSTSPGTIRLALVMNGGVSLAVWMGGVTRELDIARRASLGQPPPAGASSDQRDHHEFWRDAFTTANKRLEIDIIAGTSAGGLNGALTHGHRS